MSDNYITLLSDHVICKAMVFIECLQKHLLRLQSYERQQGRALNENAVVKNFSQESYTIFELAHLKSKKKIKFALWQHSGSVLSQYFLGISGF